jgi:cobalamin-dependent methionine synthase I
MFAANNFEVFDLGRDVPEPTVVAKAEEYGVDIICGSALMTTTMASQRDIVNLLNEDGIRNINTSSCSAAAPRVREMVPGYRGRRLYRYGRRSGCNG